MKKYIIVTGGAGFVGSNLIEYLLDKTNFEIISLDDYSTGSNKNHIKSKRVKYLDSEIKYIDKKLKKYVSKKHTSPLKMMFKALQKHFKPFTLKI